MKVFVTGASGFVGSALVRFLAKKISRTILAASRSESGFEQKNVISVRLPHLGDSSDCSALFESIDVVVHTAARVHVMRDSTADPLEEYRRINVRGTLKLARQAVDAGVKRFVFLSSIKVNGESTDPGEPFTEQSDNPQDPYGVSKLEAEKGLLALGRETGLEIVIIRPPLVYGPGVKGNFKSLLQLVNSGIPLPFGSINNRRSLIALDNLLSFIQVCMEHPAAANQVFLVSDGEDLSTTELLRRIALSMGRASILIPVPLFLLKFFFTLIGKKPMSSKLFSNLQVDITKARKVLKWNPPYDVEEGLRQTTAEM